MSIGLKTKDKSIAIKNILIKQPVVIIFLFFTIFMGIHKPNFLSLSNIQNIFVDISTYGIVASAMTIAIICGEFDLSTTSTYMWSQILFVTLINNFGSSVSGIIFSILITLISGMIIGSINGILVTKFKISSFIATLGTMIMIRGLALVFTDGNMVSTSNEFVANLGRGEILSIPYIIYIYFLVIVLAFYIMKYSRFGRNIYATGGNMEVARLTGINVIFYKFIVFVILGFASALAGILLVSQIRAGSTLYGIDMALTAIAASVIGGTSLSGGIGNVGKTFIGMLVLGILYKALIYLGLQAYYQNLIKGLVLLSVLSIDAYLNRSGKH